MSAQIANQKIWFGEGPILATLKNPVNTWGHQDEHKSVPHVLEDL